MVSLAFSPEALVDSLAPHILAARAAAEQDRRLPDALIRTMVESRLFRMWVPRALGGDEVDLVTGLEVVERLAQLDGAAAWVAMNVIGWSYLPAFLARGEALEIVGPDDAVIAGSGNMKPGTKAVAVAGGYRLTGHWGTGSGIHHATWMALSAPVWDDDQPRLTESGAPVLCSLFVPRSNIEVISTWYVGGMRGTGSEDLATNNVFVPETRTVGMPAPDSDISPLHRIPQRNLFLLEGSAVPLGIARAAITALVDLAGVKIASGTVKLLREREAVQADVARAEALLRTNRAFFYEQARVLWDIAQRGDSFSLEQRALSRLAATSNTLAATEAVDLVYHAAGTAALYETNPLDRCFRDIHALAVATAISKPSLEPIGRALMGIDTGAI